MNKDDKTWSLTKEYEENQDNIIFSESFPLKRILRELSEINEQLTPKKSSKIGLESNKKNNSNKHTTK